MINAADRVPRVDTRVGGRTISIASAGSGPPVFFLHGNGTYSYAWRNIIPYVAQRYRCLAPDLPGMGRSDRIQPSGPSSYPFEDQVAQIDLLLETLGITQKVVLVGHELGATMAIQLARKRPGMIAGLAMIEGVFRVTNDSILDPDVTDLILRLRGEEGERMVLTDNLIVEQYVPRLTARTLSPDELDAYREPYRRRGESRRAMLSMIRQLPIRSSPSPIDRTVDLSRLWCVQSTIPKLVVGGNPGFLVPPAVLGTATRWARTEVGSIPGRHYLMEDSPARLTMMLLDWLESLDGQ